MKQKLILASASARRRELLNRITSDFIAVPSEITEQVTGKPEYRVYSLARAKVHAVAKHESGIIIGADTLVVLEDEILGKPCSYNAAKYMLKRLSKRRHTVITGLYVLATESGEYRKSCERTDVYFRTLTETEIEAYLESGEYADKAGAYAIQGRASLFIERINGDYFNVMGLPLCRLYLLLRDMGVDLLRKE
jgi:septum formation protein